ncbi:malonyl-ACP O-methyltransferase BioC [Halonatronum saccharophilum]|uniref:malonyl-ACP O-methyltransferase BioC n=1 Tax=Halonatronum saccharophilum TaxID=150060 RepID=UPI000482FE66|nr:malonyl-ACP O-methyltransferase BioC [Halonatronum saccharophilum]
MIKKSLVKSNFSKAANSYDDYAVVQRYMGQHLKDYLDKNEANKVLEIGAGTGLFTQMLLDQFPKSDYLLVDISSKMISRCKEKFKDYSNISYLVEDGETLELDCSFDLIASNASFQWFEDLKGAIKNLKKHLNRGGKIYFSTFGDRTFYELRNSLVSIYGEDNYSQSFFSKEELEELLKDEFERVYIEEKEYKERFSRVRDFLRATKKIGANSATKGKPIMTKGLLKRLEQEYESRYKKDGDIIVTHHLLFVRLED